MPLPWVEDDPSLGFSPDGDARPWLPQPDFFGAYAVSRQAADPGSTLSLYREALRLRRELLADAPAGLEWVSTGRDDVLAFRRGRLTVACLFEAEAFTAPDASGRGVLASGDVDGRTLAGPVTGWFVR